MDGFSRHADPCLLTRLASSEVMTVFGSCTCKDTKSWNSNGFLVHSKNSSVTCTWVDEYVSASVLACTNSTDFGRCVHMVIKQTHPKIQTKRKQTSKQVNKQTINNRSRDGRQDLWDVVHERVLEIRRRCGLLHGVGGE